MLQGQIACVMVTPIDPTGVSMWPLSSVARDRIAAGPSMPGTHVYVQLDVPVARRHVVPPSTDTSTPPTAPPLSAAVPEMVTMVPAAIWAPCAGEAIVEIGEV